MITYILRPSCFCEILALRVSWITYHHLWFTLESLQKCMFSKICYFINFCIKNLFVLFLRCCTKYSKVTAKLLPKRDSNILHKDPKEPGTKRRKAELNQWAHEVKILWNTLRQFVLLLVFQIFLFLFFFSVWTFVYLSIYLFVRVSVPFFIRLLEFFLRNYSSNFSNFCVIQFKNWQSWDSLKKLFEFLEKFHKHIDLKLT